MLKFTGAAMLVCALAFPLPGLADDGRVPTAKEVMQAEGTPPLIPHRVTENFTFRQCLGCHEEGKEGAPVTPHPERKTCTQCHVPVDGYAPEGSGSKK